MDPVEPRDPESGDLVKICRALNESGAKYIVIGGMALVYHIPFANPELLLKTKQTVREKDEIDRLFLQRLIAERHKA